MKTKRKFLSVLLLGLLFISPEISQAQNADTIWTIRLAGGAGPYTGLYEVIQTMDGNYVAAGLYFTEETQTDIWVIKFTPDGGILWNMNYQTDTLNLWLTERIRGIKEISTGEIVVFAATQEDKHYLIFLNQEGQKIKQVKYIDSEDPFYAYSMAVTADDKFLVAGDHSVYVENNWFKHSWYRKIDVSGNMIWERSLPSGAMAG